MTMRRWPLAALLCCLVLPAWAGPPAGSPPPGLAPERMAAYARSHMVAAANPLAAAAGRTILQAGGSAVDAAIAVQMVLTLVEPQSSGIGGGAFLLHWSAAGRELRTYDGRETAPAAAGPNLFLGADGRPLRFMDAVVGGLSVGVPGAVRMLEAAHRAHGRLPWADLFQPAIALARDGFAISPRLAATLQDDAALRADPAAGPYFYQPDGSPKPAGTLLANPALAATLQAIATGGADALHTGPIAQDIVAAVAGAARPGSMTLADLVGYRPQVRDAVCVPYRLWRVCGMGPPSSGGVAIAQVLGMVERHDLTAAGPASPDAWHLLLEASRLAFADRDRYVADPDRVPLPPGLLDRRYLADRGGLIRTGESLGRATAGEPPGKRADFAPDRSLEIPATSHMVIVDRDGNAVSMTTTIEGPFGSKLMVRGFLLNNELTDFSFVPEADGRPVANRVEGGKRPRSSMSPTMVFDRDGRLVMALGSPGGARIIGYTLKALVAMLDWDLDPQRAVSLPNLLNRNGPTELEMTPGAGPLADGLRRLGHEVQPMTAPSGLQAIRLLPGGGLVGGADPRREGVAVGD
ncbi:gamma-glutamyltransferase 1 [Stella humosa]|uniref:Glutathione hydrolase proenzyme n=1 Tax=Stella humosa TaxID=94 RepID=A0A3N1KYH9_9PROT|nr:gamma-glutamyltransferase [Stella humosa]ROP84217.1 gamma-glutamyltransferase 1 [Stella humosa]BBK33729.1 gamma-glutamyltranspeptidase [Stella humosa]